MSAVPSVAFNPLTWFLTADGDLTGDDAPPLEQVYREIRAAGFDAVHAEPPADMTTEDYRSLLEDTDLSPAPGYFQAVFSDADQHVDIAERAARVAAQHAALGLTRIFIADQFWAQPRLEVPAQGVDGHPDRIATIADGPTAAGEAMVAEGVVPCLHQHVGTWIETPEETEAILAAVPADVLLLGPDTGHLSWAGADPVAFINKHLARVGAVHLKDFRSALAHEARQSGEGYRSVTGRHLWTEPGRGDVDFGAVLAVLAKFEGWYVIEVDIADQATPQDSARVSAAWVREALGQSR